MTVLDASALLAFLFAEPGSERVAEVLSTSCISAVNLSEGLACFHRRGLDVAGLPHQLERSGMEIAAFDTDAAERTAQLLPLTSPQGLSLGDRACLALARQRHCTVLTADRIWAEIRLDLEIRLIR